MFTIKHCHDFREELYHSVDEVQAFMNLARDPNVPLPGVAFKTAATHHFLQHSAAREWHEEGCAISKTPEGAPVPGCDCRACNVPADGGMVFVMNEQARTVATYRLSE